MPSLPSVLIVDDEVRSQESLCRTLEEDFEVFTASGAAEARAILEGQTCEIVLTDQRMPGVSGVEFLKEVQRDWPDSVRIIISGYTDSQDIIAGINEAGIYQYLLKPWHPDQLLLTLKRAAELYRLQRENCQLAVELRAALPVPRGRVEATRRRVRRAFALDQIVRTPGSPMGAVCDLVERAARFDVAVLLCGESGTGKELLARAIHYASPRAERAFVVENCGALPDNLLESELFGHKRGSFTGAYEDRIGLFQQADGGTLFLDEIGETSPAFQVKLLRVLQEGECRPLGGPRPDRGRRAPDHRDQPRPGGRGQGRPLPRGPLLPPGHGPATPATPAGATPGHPGPGRGGPGQGRRRPRPAGGASPPTPGPAMCGSCRTSYSGCWSSPTVPS